MDGNESSGLVKCGLQTAGPTMLKVRSAGPLVTVTLSASFVGPLSSSVGVSFLVRLLTDVSGPAQLTGSVTTTGYGCGGGGTAAGVEGGVAQGVAPGCA